MRRNPEFRPCREERVLSHLLMQRILLRVYTNGTRLHCKIIRKRDKWNIDAYEFSFNVINMISYYYLDLQSPKHEIDALDEPHFGIRLV